MSTLKINNFKTVAGDTYESVLQVKHFSYPTVESFTLGDAVPYDTNLKLSIKPLFANSKILLIGSVCTFYVPNVSVMRIRFKRTPFTTLSPAGNNTGGYSVWTALNYAQVDSWGDSMTPNSEIYWMDSPASTGEVLYTCQLSSNNGSATVGLNRYTHNTLWSGCSHMTLLEIAQ
jgi:hypothetical protein